MSVTLQFVMGAGISSRAISWFSAGSGKKGFSHVDAVLDSGRLYGARSDRIGEQPSGVYDRPAGYDTWSHRVTIELPATDNQRRLWLKFLQDQYADPYDRFAIFGFVTGRAWREEGAWICSELQARALEMSGTVPPLYLAASRITPEALALACSMVAGRIIVDHDPVPVLA